MTKPTFKEITTKPMEDVFPPPHPLITRTGVVNSRGEWLGAGVSHKGAVISAIERGAPDEDGQVTICFISEALHDVINATTPAKKPQVVEVKEDGKVIGYDLASEEEARQQAADAIGKPWTMSPEMVDTLLFFGRTLGEPVATTPANGGIHWYDDRPGHEFDIHVCLYTKLGEERCHIHCLGMTDKEKRKTLALVGHCMLADIPCEVE